MSFFYSVFFYSIHLDLNSQPLRDISHFCDSIIKHPKGTIPLTQGTSNESDLRRAIHHTLSFSYIER